MAEEFKLWDPDEGSPRWKFFFERFGDKTKEVMRWVVSASADYNYNPCETGSLPLYIAAAQLTGKPIYESLPGCIRAKLELFSGGGEEIEIKVDTPEAARETAEWVNREVRQVKDLKAGRIPEFLKDAVEGFKVQRDYTAKVLREQFGEDIKCYRGGPTTRTTLIPQPGGPQLSQIFKLLTQVAEPENRRLLVSCTVSRRVAETFDKVARESGLRVLKVREWTIKPEDVLSSWLTEVGFVHDEDELLLMRDP